jgi:hypothetical protein
VLTGARIMPRGEKIFIVVELEATVPPYAVPTCTGDVPLQENVEGVSVNLRVSAQTLLIL